MNIQELLELGLNSRDEKMPAPCTDDQIVAFEKEHNVTLPDAYKKFLMITNGPRVGATGIYGINTLDTYLDLGNEVLSHSSYLKMGFLPVSDDGFGNHFIINLKECDEQYSPVYFIDEGSKPNELAYRVSSSFERFVFFYINEDINSDSDWPFEESFTVAHDPNIMKFDDELQPWKMD